MGAHLAAGDGRRIIVEVRAVIPSKRCGIRRSMRRHFAGWRSRPQRSWSRAGAIGLREAGRPERPSSRDQARSVNMSVSGRSNEGDHYDDASI